MSLPNVYYLVDVTSAQAGPVGSGQTGGGSGEILSPDFTAPSGAAAIQVAHIIASALQRPVGVVAKYAAPGLPTIVQGASANVALTVVPSGVGY